MTLRRSQAFITHLKENAMAQAKQGDIVQIHYTGRLDDGTVFDTSSERHPLRFTIGKGQVIAGVEQAIVGMNTGEFKTAKLPFELAYGPRRDDMIVTMDRSQLPPDLNPMVGQRLELTQTDDQKILATVTDITASTLTLDANHPLAGKTLTFDIELVAIV
jgi:peptidylprolyl isomerase